MTTKPNQRVLLKAAGSYFAVVFGAGFVFGVIRVLFVIPRIGVRAAELIEMPVMVFVTILAARWMVRCFALSDTFARAVVGFIALSLLLVAEAGLVWVSGSSISQFVSTRDPVSGIAYLGALILVGIMPLFWRALPSGNSSSLL
jgi:hypothetical protein